jgi:hypothetical protein
MIVWLSFPHPTPCPLGETVKGASLSISRLILTLMPTRGEDQAWRCGESLRG